jgi:hypothetical protein
MGVSDPQSDQATQQISRLKMPMLFGAVLALMGASVYMLLQVHQLRNAQEESRNEQDQLRNELAETRGQLLAEIGKVHESSTVSTQNDKDLVDSLKAELVAARRQARTLAGEAKLEATKHADELAAKLGRIQDEQAKKVTAVNDAVSQVKTDADATKTRVGEVSSEVGSVKDDLIAAKSELEKAVADLKSTTGDLGIQSGLIATNARELLALKELGERVYTEFNLPKEKARRKIGEIQIRLKATDPKHNRYTVEVLADDKLIEKKDKTVNEPVQFVLSRANQPYELVVNDIKKDRISGYVAAPKAQQVRSQDK